MRSSILMLGLVVGEVAAGCGFRSSPSAAADSGGSDSGGDDSNGGCTSFATLVNTCQLTFDADLMVTEGATYDTDVHVLMIGATATPVAIKTVMIGPDQVDVISAHNVQLAASVTLRANGSHGLVIVANNDFTIEASSQIDVSNGGAGARTSCPSGAAKGDDDNNGAGGGGGGGFGADGGHGGDGHNGQSQGGSQGKAEPEFPTGFHGGCPGADGGVGQAPGGTGGKGGGALYVVAGGHLVLNSSAPLNAGGSGGAGGHGSNNGDAGGGGGGSGGLLILETPHIVMGTAATVAANGGAGGEGSDQNGMNGAGGANASVNTNRATGGAGAAGSGSDGGDGGSSSGPAGDSVTDNVSGGGGGGGGGVGFIRVISPDPKSLAASPAPG
jgi:hypothetical protein